MLAILDYGAGNRTSVRRALEHLGVPCEIRARPDSLDSFLGLLVPGVGAAGQAMAALEKSGLDSALVRAAAKGVPILGVCLGCQIMLERSEEGGGRLLGLAPGFCERFPEGLADEAGERIRIPHMGWNSLKKVRESPLLAGIPEDAEFYFVHSYFTRPREDLVLATTRHGLEFCSVHGRDGLWGAQFHPEKSGTSGLRLLENFALYCRERANAF